MIADPPCVFKGLLVGGSLRRQGLILHMEANEFELCSPRAVVLFCEVMLPHVNR